MNNGKLIYFEEFFLILIIFCFSCSDNFYGDKDLGSDFYYIVEPSLNSIYIAKFRDDPHEYLGPYVIRNINLLGLNKKFILVCSKINDSINYYLIDKENELKRNYNDRLIKTNLIVLDSLKFFELQKKYKIEIKTNEEYSKEDGWK